VAQGRLFDSQDTKMYTSMLDQQLSQALAKRGIGLADVMVRQMSRGSAPVDPGPEGPKAPVGDPAPAASPATTSAPAAAPAPAQPAQPRPAGSAQLPESARQFIGQMWPHAVDAGRTTGIAPHFILGQAALESGWGRAEIRMPDGSSSHNLFGIKAGRGWNGAVAEVATTEYVNGAPVKTVERFRAYGSYAEAFRDYAGLLAGNSRYAGVLGNRTDPAAFAKSLQQAGYATDPAYADKLTRVITGGVMRSGLAG